MVYFILGFILFLIVMFPIALTIGGLMKINKKIDDWRFNRKK